MRVLVVIAVAWAWPQLSQAHALGKSFLDVKPTPEGASVIFDLDPDDLEPAMQSALDNDGSGLIEPAELKLHLDTIAQLQRTGLVVTRDDMRCQSAITQKRVSPEANMVRTHLLFTCQQGALGVHLPLLKSLKPGHATLVTLRLPGGVQGLVLNRQNPSYSDGGPQVWASVVRFFGLGVEHILTGYDHLLFLLALLLVARGVGDIVRVVTSFTVAHSLTLIAASTGTLSLPASFVEPAIALSIAYVGAENLWAKQAQHRVWLTFALGLVHGFGFAGLVNNMGLPEHGRVAALLSFNLGVETGQLLIVLCLVPVFAWLGTRINNRYLTQVGSAAVVVVGLYWFVERVI